MIRTIFVFVGEVLLVVDGLVFFGDMLLGSDGRVCCDIREQIMKMGKVMTEERDSSRQFQSKGKVR